MALLASYLSERVRVQNRELDLRQGAVARLQALNENIIASIHSGLLTTDLSGRINFMNRGGAEITGCPQDAVEGRPVMEVLGVEPAVLDDVLAQLRHRRRVRFERTATVASGAKVFLGVAASVLKDRADEPLGYIFTFQDLTDVHAQEQHERLKERMAALGQMAAGMAHE